jgi:cholesterol transport system auxiliary component
MLVLLLTLTAAGCTILPTKQATRLYLLTPKSTYTTTLPKVDWQLSIDAPIAESGLNTSRVAIMRKPLTMEYFERANWVDTAPRMIHRLLVESFENSKRIVGVGRQSATLRADYTLITELREFQAESYDGKQTIHVRINAKLVRLPERIIVSTTSADHRVPFEESGMDDIVHAFDAALGKALKEVVNWTLQAVPPASPRARARRRR